MPLLDRIKDAVTRVLPPKDNIPAPVSTSMSGGIGNGHGMAEFEDDMIVSKPAIVFHASQIFFNFLAMACFASVASFQAKWGVGPSGLTGFALFISVAGIFLSLFMLMVPVIYEKYDKLSRLARALKEVRVAFILVGSGTGASLLIAFIVTISAWTEPGCKNATNDPNAKKGDDFKNGLSGWCSTKKAGSIFFWLVFGFWLASLVLTLLDWRSGRSTRPKDPPFIHPMTASEHDLDEEEGDEESQYHQIPPIRRASAIDSNLNSSPFSDSNRYSGASSTTVPGSFGAAPAPSRPSMDAYGAFSDPPPSGFGAGPAGGAEQNPQMSRTMQYANPAYNDPYAAVRASLAGGGAPTTPPSYETYQGYR